MPVRYKLNLIISFEHSYIPFLGCLNGGAQVRSTSHAASKELVLELEKMYSRLPQKSPEQNQNVRELYESWLGGTDSDKSNTILHTHYHAVEKMTTALNIKW